MYSIVYAWPEAIFFFVFVFFVGDFMVVQREKKKERREYDDMVGDSELGHLEFGVVASLATVAK